MINYNMNANEHWDNTNGDNETSNFSPEVHELVGMLIPIMLTNTWWLAANWYHAKPSLGTARTYHK
jgi:hypothetical protein